MLKITVFALVLGTFSLRAQVGTVWPGEWHRFADKQTGVTITALTTSTAKDNKLYQTHPNWTSDGNYIVFVSDRSGTNQYFAIDLHTGEIVQLTADAAPGQACLKRNQNSMIYENNGILWQLDLKKLLNKNRKDLSGIRKKIATLPDNISLSGSTSLDANDQLLYLGIKEGEENYAIMSLDLNTGAFQKIIDVGFQVGHCQAHPSVSGLIMYCWETGGDAEQRMWIVKNDGSDNTPFYKETYGEWVTHEVWWGKQKALFTIWPKDDKMLTKPYGIAWISLEERSLQILDRKKYWHVGGSSDGSQAVGDTFEGNLWLINGNSGQASLLTTGHRSEGQTVHPHPSFSPDGKKVLFCSEMFGNWDLFLADLPASQPGK